jgi:hypothetical protein
VKPERFRPLLERFQREECFVAVTIDLDDDPSNLEILRGYTRDTLISTEWRVWEPNFVEANYSAHDLALVAMQHATPHAGKARDPFMLTGEEIEQSMRAHNEQVSERGNGSKWTLEYALGVVLGRDKGHTLAKGTELGNALAAWTFTADSPAVMEDEDKKRPVIALFDNLLGATSSSYHISARRQAIDENGHRCPPSR